MAGEPRETAGTTVCLVVSYVRAHAGEEAVARLLEVFPGHTLAEIEDEHHWWTYEQKTALFDAACDVLDDPDAVRHIGEQALQQQVGWGLRVLIRRLGSPRLVVENIAKACPRFTSVATMTTESVDRESAVVTYRLDPDRTPHRGDCQMNLGLMSTIGPIFGKPLLQIDHPECQVDGAPACRYIVHFPERAGRRARRRARSRELAGQVTDLSAQLESLQSTMADLVSPDDIDAVLTRILSRAGQAVGAPAHLLTIDGGPGLRPTVLAKGIEDHRRAAVAESTRAAPVGADGRRIVIEVASSQRVYGRLAAFSDQDTFFPHEATLLAAYARSAAAALDAATALDESRRHAQTTEAMFALARSLAEPATPDRIARLVAGAMTDILSVGAAAVMLWDQGRATLRVAGRSGWPADAAPMIDSLAFDRHTLARWSSFLDAPDTGVCRVDELPPGRVRSGLEYHGIPGLAIAPIRAHAGQFYGLAIAAIREPDAVVGGLREHLTAIADTCATALQNAALLEQIRHQAVHDGLTGLANRALFDEGLERAIAHTQRRGEPTSVLFIDLDDFKAVNDRFGHAAGDHVLRTVATRLTDEGRRSDSVARLGGDEFAMLLMGTSAPDAAAVADRLRTSIRQPIALGDTEVTIAASIGAATIPDDADGSVAAVRAADAEMYRRKRAARQLLSVTDSSDGVLSGPAPPRPPTS